MDITNIHFQQINLPFSPEPNTGFPVAIKEGDDIRLEFDEYNEAWEQKTAVMLFSDCIMYRIGDPNEDGFDSFGFDENIVNTSIYSKKNFPQLKLNKFYEVIGFNWEEFSLGGGTVFVQNSSTKKRYTHYLFLMRSGAFECIASDFKVVSF